jgi:hypothetical protein
MAEAAGTFARGRCPMTSAPAVASRMVSMDKAAMSGQKCSKGGQRYEVSSTRAPRMGQRSPMLIPTSRSDWWNFWRAWQLPAAVVVKQFVVVVQWRMFYFISHFPASGLVSVSVSVSLMDSRSFCSAWSERGSLWTWELLTWWSPFILVRAHRSHHLENAESSKIRSTADAPPDLYGTRLAQVLLVRRDGRVTYIERDIWALDGTGAAAVRASPENMRSFIFRLGVWLVKKVSFSKGEGGKRNVESFFFFFFDARLSEKCVGYSQGHKWTCMGYLHVNEFFLARVSLGIAVESWSISARVWVFPYAVSGDR